MCSGNITLPAAARIRPFSFPPSQLERRSDKRQREHRAKEICASCPVEKDCRTYAIEIREQHGIWGGMTEGERRLLGGW